MPKGTTIRKTTPRKINVGDGPRRKKDMSKYDTYIKKVLKQIHPDQGINSEAVADINQMIHLTLEKIMKASNDLATHQREQKKTLKSQDIQAAVALVYTGELAKHAKAEGDKAMIKISTFKGRPKVPIRKEEKAGIIFPVARIETAMMNHSVFSRKGKYAAVILAAVLEYTIAELIETAGNAARDNKRYRISSRDLMMAIQSDRELSKLYKDVVLSGGVISSVSWEVLTHQKSKKKGKKGK